jgi:hypothetical protein
MNNKSLLLVAIILMSGNAIADTGFVCIADLVSGFHHNAERDNWEQATFLPGERFLISEIRQDVYKVETPGERNAWSTICTLRTDQTSDSFSCESGTNELHFNRSELRFTAFRYFGYWNGSKDSLSITIGKCFPS